MPDRTPPPAPPPPRPALRPPKRPPKRLDDGPELRDLLLPLAAGAALLALCGLLLPALAAGPALRGDPTRPPPGVLTEAAPANGAAAAGTGPLPVARLPAAPAASAPPPPPPPAPLPVLQGVQVHPRNPATALLDGRLVQTGDLVGERRVLVIDNEGVTLGGPGRAQVRLNLVHLSAKLPPGSIVTSRSTGYAAERAASRPATGTAAAAPPPAEPDVATAPRTSP